MSGRPIVLDVGSANTRIGFAGFPTPESIFPTVVGRPRAPGMKGLLLGHATDLFVGDQVDSLEDAHGLVLPHVPGLPDDERERYLEMLFESFSVPSVCFTSAAPTVLYATGRTTGLALCSGHGVSHAVPVFAGVEMTHQHVYSNFGGADVSSLLSQVLSERGFPLFPDIPTDRSILETVKSALCCVRASPLLPPPDGQAHVLPDGSVITLGLDVDRVTAPAVATLGALAAEALIPLPPDARAAIASAIVLDGGNMLMQGLPERLQGDIAALLAAGALPAESVGLPRHGLGAGGASRAAVLATAAAAGADPARVTDSIDGASAAGGPHDSFDRVRASESARGAPRAGTGASAHPHGTRASVDVSVGRPTGSASGARTSAAAAAVATAAAVSVDDVLIDAKPAAAVEDVLVLPSDPATAKVVSVHAHAARHHLAWAGGSILGALSTYKDMAYQKAAYDESGVSLLYTK